MLTSGGDAADARRHENEEPERRRGRERALTETPGRCRSSRSSCGPRRGSGRATSRARPRSSGTGTTPPARRSACRGRRCPGVSQRCPWTWNVWKSEPIAITSHWTTSPTFAWNTGVLPTKARPSIAMNLPIGANTTSNSWSGARSFRPRIDSIPYIPPSIESIIDGEWSWYGHTPAESLPAVNSYV